jgi:hypothetical protein
MESSRALSSIEALNALIARLAHGPQPHDVQVSLFPGTVHLQRTLRRHQGQYPVNGISSFRLHAESLL